jgi:two-component system, chemotaxis family, sensor kinase Cph1
LKKRKPITEAKNIRQMAENQMKRRTSDVDANSSEGDVRRLVHELQVHQIELEMQNEELVRAGEMIAAAANEKYKELYDFAPTAYFTISKAGNILELNLKGASMLGKERQRLINLKFNNFISGETHLIFDEFLQKVFVKKTAETCEVIMSLNPSVQSFVFITGYAIENGEQCLLSVIDISPRIKAETELKNKMDELKKAYKQLEEYSFHNQELKHFANISSHELQQPMRTIYNFIQIYEDEYATAIDDKAYKYLSIIKDSAKRMYILITALSDYAKLGLNKTLRLVNFKDLIDNVISDLDAAIKSTGAEILISEMPVINAYEIEMHQLFLNLISNAIKFHNKDVRPVVRVVSEKTGDKWKFSVSDNGIGISPVNFGQLFNMFQRLHSDENEFEGKGIGLTLCKKIVELHQGHIWVESNKEQGVTFYFTIPSLIL